MKFSDVNKADAFEVWTPQRRAEDAARRWKLQYFRPPQRAHSPHWRGSMEGAVWHSDAMEATHEALCALEKPDAETVNAIIGNDSWTRTECEVCGTLDAPVVVFDVGDMYCTEVCRSCLVSMVEAMP